MVKKRRIYYWDSSVFLAHFNGEPELNQGINEILKELEEGSSIIATSSFTIVEVFKGKFDDKSAKIIDAFFMRREIVHVALDRIIANIAKDFCRHFDNLHGKNPREPKISPDDAVHLATAVFMDVDECHVKGDWSSVHGKHPRIRFPICLPRGRHPLLPSR